MTDIEAVSVKCPRCSHNVEINPFGIEDTLRALREKVKELRQAVTDAKGQFCTIRDETEPYQSAHAYAKTGIKMMDGLGAYGWQMNYD